MPETTRMISLDQAVNILKSQLSDMKLPTEIVPVQQAIGRVTVEDQLSLFDIPPFDKSAMDGYAVTADDGYSEYRVLETVVAGDVPAKRLTPGTATKIMTGAPVPNGADKVIMIEKTSEIDGRMRILVPDDAVNICRKGEDIRCGEKVLSAGTIISPLEVGNLVSVGITHVKTARPVRVGIISTGDEIVDHPDQLANGKIMNSNGPMLSGLCCQYGFEVVCQISVPDQLNATVTMLRERLEQADMLILSGGVSVGQFDFVPEAMRQIGLTVHFDRVAVKPGKPMTFATSDKKVVVGLPGNPVAVFLMFHLFVLKAAGLMAGRETSIRKVSFPLAFDFHRRKADRMAFIPCRLGQDATLHSVEYHGTAHLKALLDCDGFFIVHKGITAISSGQKVDYVMLKRGFE